MPEPWEDAPITTAARPVEDWEKAPITVPAGVPDKAAFGLGLRAVMQSGALGHALAAATRNNESNGPQRVADGVADAWTAGLQGSSSALLVRGKLPDVVLDAHNAKWYEKLAAGAGQIVGDLPVMVGAGAAAGAAAIETGPGAVVIGGAAAFATPTALRESLMLAYSMDQVQSSGDFLSRAGVVLKRTGTDAIVGGLTGGAGHYAGKLATPFIGEAVTAGRIGTTTGRVLTTGATMGAEGTTMVVAPALLEGRLPEPEDFTNAAILMVGLKTAHFTAGKLRTIYAKTGIEPLQVAADAKADPTILEELRAPESPEAQAVEIPRAYQEQAARSAAADAFPGEKAQAVLDAPFADIPDTKLPHQLNMKYINGPEDMRALQTRMSEVYRSDIDTARGGTQKWEEIEAKAAVQVATLTGAELEKVMAGRQVGDTANAVELKIRGDMLMQATVDAAEAIKRVKDTPPAEQTDAMRLDALEAIHRSAMVQADLTGSGSELARALGYMKQIKELRAQGEGMRKLVETYGHDPARMLEMAATLDTPEKLAKFAREANKATTEQMILEAWKSALVSGPFTQVANIMGNSTYMALRPLVDAAAAVTGWATRAPERVYATEALARVFGDLHGIMDGLNLAKVSMMVDEAGGKAGSRSAIPGTAGYIIRTPFRALSAMDQVFRTMTERGEAYALGTRQAIKEGFNPATREFRERVAELAQNPSEAAIEKIKAFGERGTFNSALGEKGQAINNAIVKAHLEFAVPFRGTPANVFKEMARLTPAAPIIKEWREAVALGGPEGQKAWAEVMVGTSLSALTMTLAMGGHISGQGDPDPNKRRVKQAAGWQPYSVKVNGTWYSYQRFQPVGTLVGLAADMAEVWEHMTPDESDKVVKMMGTAFAQAVTNQTFLQGISTLTAAITQPEQKMGRWVQNMVSSVVPALSAQTAQLMDPYKREVNSIREAVMNRIPGLRESLPPQRDPYGEPIPNDERLGYVSPVVTKEQATDKVRTEAARLGVGEGKAPKNIQIPTGGIGGAKLGKVELTPEQRDVFANVSGKLAYQVLDGMVNGPAWESMGEEAQKKAFKLVFERTKAAGKAAALTDEQRQKEVDRIMAEVDKRLAK